jgi:imidazole glycerol-phosphate synthase subunit HisF
MVGEGERLGAGEIVVNSMDADGTRSGFDLEMLRAVRQALLHSSCGQRRGRGA